MGKSQSEIFENNRIPGLQITILIFSILFAIFFVGPAMLGRDFPLYPAMKVGDVFDIFTPLILIPCYWLLLRFASDKVPKLWAIVIFIILAAFWIQGQGMHLSANSIGHLLQPGTPAYQLTYFYDEVLSHYLWHFGIVGIMVLLIVYQRLFTEIRQKALWWLIIISGIIHGFTYFIIVIEAGTAPLGIPFSLAITIYGLIWGRDKLHTKPLVAFFVVSCCLASILFIGWGIYWKGLPQFSELGII